MLVKSPVAVSTSLPPGRFAAMSPANTDTWLSLDGPRLTGSHLPIPGDASARNTP